MTSPIFIHSLFRTGSTYIFKVFRRSLAGYWCYQEPLHEIVFLSKNHQDDLLAFTSSTSKESLRHPDIGNAYFWELYEVHDAWKDIISKEISYDDYFNLGDSEGLIRYFSALIESAKGIPVIQECRTASRISTLKKHFGGTHIYLWRNPWDQWWSYKTTDYFDSVNQVILNSNIVPEIINRLRFQIGFNPYQSDDIYDEVAHYGSRRLAPEENFMVFYTLWCLGLIEGMKHSDVLINIDALSNQATYRQEIQKRLELCGISDITFDDCKITQTYYTKKDREFFQKIEDRVHGLLLLSRYPQRVIDQITGLRQEFEPAIWKLPLEEIPSELLVENAVRARDQVKRIEQRESVQLAQAEATITDGKTKEYEANVRAEQTEARRREAIIRAEQAEVLAREAINRATRVEGQVSELNNRVAYLSTVLRDVYASDSWRVTSPLRLVGGWGRNVLHTTLEFILARPRLRKYTGKILSFLPPLKSKLKLFKEANIGAKPVPPQTKKTLRRESNLNVDILNLAFDGQFKPTPNLVFPLEKGYRHIYYYVDHTILCPFNTGIQRVTRRLGRSLLEAGEKLFLVKWDADHDQFSLLNQTELAYLSQWHGPLLSYTDLQQYPNESDDPISVEKHVTEAGHWLVVPEVTHITYQAQPMTLNVLMEAKRQGLKTAFIFYDALPLKHADLQEAAAKHETYMQQLLLADLVIPISDWSARDLVSFLQVHEKAILTPTPCIAAIPLPGESQKAPRVTTPLKQKEVSKLILSVGSIVPHKNQLALVQAFQRYCEAYPETDWALSLIGNFHPDLASQINQATAQNPRIKYWQHIPDGELEKLYRACAFTVFPSVDEGFGLPIVESLWFGKPCICANFGSMAEIAEDGGCLTVDTRKSEELFHALTRLINEPDLLEQLSQEAVTRSITSWDDYSNRFSALLNEATDPLKQMGVIYYWIDHTTTFYKNTGIQRVTRALARALMELGFRLIPVKWDKSSKQFYQPSKDELAYLAQWNGPKPSDWSAWVNPVFASPNDWILIPELTSYLLQSQLEDVKSCTAAHKLRSAIVFYDAIPYKMQEIFPSEFSEAHRRYMGWLSEFDLVFPISEFSRADLLSFLVAMPRKTTGLEYKIQTCALPGEFLESDRVIEVSRRDSAVTKILCAGTVESRKNHLGLLQAFTEVIKRTAKPVELYIVGRSAEPDLAEIVQSYVKDHSFIHWEQDADDTRLRELYAECDFTVYPSLEEGFGLPILESLWYGRPCICRNSGAMAEVAEGGGCLMVETADPKELADAMHRMIEDVLFRFQLAEEAVSRPFKTWRDYAREVATRLATERYITLHQDFPESVDKAKFYSDFVNLQPRPLLSVCISTYNRAEWLSMNLKNLARLLPIPRAEVEVVVCDNNSSDHTSQLVQPYLHRSDFRYYSNSQNVGMLGNLKATAHHARGRYIWILGDNNLVKPGSIEKVLDIIQQLPDISLIYLNYAQTQQENPNAIVDLDQFLNESVSVVEPTEDVLTTVSDICTKSANFFTSICCLVFRRDHAMRAYTQNTEDGRPFSTLVTCAPTAYYALNFMMNESAYWVGEPQVVMHSNVWWKKYMPLWVLERVPEIYDLAERFGADPAAIDYWRNHTLPDIIYWFREIYKHDEEGNIAYFSPSRLVSRIKHLDGFTEKAQELQAIYKNAYAAGHPGAKIPPSQVFPTVKNSQGELK